MCDHQLVILYHKIQFVINTIIFILECLTKNVCVDFTKHNVHILTTDYDTTVQRLSHKYTMKEFIYLVMRIFFFSKFSDSFTISEILKELTEDWI